MWAFWALIVNADIAGSVEMECDSEREQLKYVRIIQKTFLRSWETYWQNIFSYPYRLGLYPWQLWRTAEIYHNELKLSLLPHFFLSVSFSRTFSRISGERERFEKDRVDRARTIQYLLLPYWQQRRTFRETVQKPEIVKDTMDKMIFEFFHTVWICGMRGW